MKFHLYLMTAAVFAAMAAPVQAQWSVTVSEASIMAATAGADSQPEDIAVAANGDIIVVDENANTETVIRFNSSGGAGAVVTNEAAIVAALNAANGTSADVVAITINSVSVAADGDLVLTNGDSGAPDSVVTVSPAGVITVVSTSLNGAASPTEGCTASTVVGNIAYVCVNGAFGAAEDAILAVDTNAVGPAVAGTVVASQAALEAAMTGETAGAANLGPITAGGTGLYVADSGGFGTSDDVLQIALPGGAVNLLIEDTAVETAFGDTDVGYAGIAVDQSGAVWLTNAFGGVNGDDSVVKVSNPGTGTQAIQTFTEATINTDTGDATGVSPARAAFNSSNNRILFADQGGDVEGVLGMSTVSSVGEWSLY